MARPFWTRLRQGVLNRTRAAGAGPGGQGQRRGQGAWLEALGGAVQGVVGGRGPVGGAPWSGAGLRQKRAGPGLAVGLVLEAPRAAASRKLLGSQLSLLHR